MTHRPGREETRGLDEAGPRCGLNSEYTSNGCRCGLCVSAHSSAMALYQATRSLARGRPVWALSAYQRDAVEDELAYREGRQFWSIIDSQVVKTVVPRWVGDGWFAPRRTVLEQLVAAKAHGEP